MRCATIAVLLGLCLVLATSLPEATSAAPSAKTCYRCHEELRSRVAGKARVHAPLQEGNCVACHNPHASESRGLIDGRIDESCYRCHTRMKREAEGKTVHSALQRGSCTDCHDPHAGGPALLKQEMKPLCLSCHQRLEAQLKAPHQNPPFAQGKCLSCHRPHFAEQPNLLGQSATSLCLSCHEPRCKAGDVSIAQLTRRMDCTGCHSPHASANRGLLGAYGHQSFLTGECSACHEPPAGGKLPLKAPGRQLCFSCHSRLIAWLERPSQHVLDSQPCTRCHNPHAATSEARLVSREGPLCFSCHADTEQRMLAAEQTIRGNCEPIMRRQCSGCHDPHASSFALYLKTGTEHVCERCHKRQHRISHPLGEDAIDHRNRQPMQCVSCHKMHGPPEEFMLYLDGKRALCIECHRY